MRRNATDQPSLLSYKASVVTNKHICDSSLFYLYPLAVLYYYHSHPLSLILTQFLIFIFTLIYVYRYVFVYQYGQEHVTAQGKTCSLTKHYLK